MVKATSLILASFAIAPLVFAVPLNSEQSTDIAIRSVDDTADALEARTPEPWKFKMPKVNLKKIMPLVRQATPYAIKGLGLVAKVALRDETGGVYTRDIYLSDLTERDLEDLGLSLDARDFEDMTDELETRAPKRKKWGAKLKGAIGKARKFASGVSKATAFFNPGSAAMAGLGLREFDDDELFDARDFVDLDDFLERGFEDIDDLEVRAPLKKLNLRPIKRAKHVASQVLNVANKANNFLSSLGLREFDEEDLFDARDFEDLDELETREPLKRKKLNLKGIKRGKRLVPREFEDEGLEMEARSIEDLD